MKLPKKPVKAQRKQSENPYMNARRQWNDHVALPVQTSRMWQMVALLALFIAACAVGGVIHIGSQSKFVPYVIEVDQLGEARAAMPAQRSSVVDPRVKHAFVARFISDLRMVTPDIQLQRESIFRVYSMMASGDPARQKAQEWYSSNSPLERAREETVSIEIKSVIPQSETTWQVDWIESVRDRKGKLVSQPFRMRALVQLYVSQPDASTSEEEIRKNPLGIFVRDYNWQKQV